MPTCVEASPKYEYYRRRGGNTTVSVDILLCLKDNPTQERTRSTRARTGTVALDAWEWWITTDLHRACTTFLHLAGWRSPSIPALRTCTLHCSVTRLPRIRFRTSDRPVNTVASYSQSREGRPAAAGHGMTRWNWRRRRRWQLHPHPPCLPGFISIFHAPQGDLTCGLLWRARRVVSIRSNSKRL